jgi:hypothetical protein
MPRRFPNPIRRILDSNELSKAAYCPMIGFSGVPGTCCRILGEFEKVKNEGPKQNVKIQPDLSWIDKKALGPELSSTLLAIKIAKRSDQNFYIALAEGVGNPVFKNEKPYCSMNYADVGIRLLTLFRYWNMVNYYFRYKNLITENWSAVLTQSIPAFVEAKDELSYKLAVLSEVSPRLRKASRILLER